MNSPFNRFVLSVHPRACLTVVVVVVLTACGSKTTSPSGTPGPSGATITILAGGVASPKAVQITSGQSVTFINNDNRTHDMTSDPHPTHTQCPPINAASNISPGQTKLTNALSAGTCGFHDHNDPDNTNLAGTITIR